MQASQTIWHLSWEYPPFYTGGLGVACAGIVDALRSRVMVRLWSPSELEEAHSSYSAYTDEREGSGETLGLLERVLSGKGKFGRSYLERVLCFCGNVAAQRPTEGVIVHAHDWHTVLAAIALKRRYGTPFVLHLHSTQLEREGLQAQNNVYELERWGMDEAERVICVSECSAHFVTHYYEIDRSKVTVVLNASSMEVQRRTVSGSAKTLLFVGRMCSQKSPELVLEIMRRLVQRCPDVRLMLLGTGDELSRMRELIDFCGLDHCVQLLGEIGFKQMQGLYQKADFLCLPSIAEPFGLVAVEAAQNGLAVLMSDRCGASELLVSAPQIKHREVTEWVNALSQLIENPKAYRELVRCLQKEAASRTWQDAANEILAVYASLGN